MVKDQEVPRSEICLLSCLFFIVSGANVVSNRSMPHYFFDDIEGEHAVATGMVLILVGLVGLWNTYLVHIWKISGRTLTLPLRLLAAVLICMLLPFASHLVGTEIRLGPLLYFVSVTTLLFFGHRFHLAINKANRAQGPSSNNART